MLDGLIGGRFCAHESTARINTPKATRPIIVRRLEFVMEVLLGKFTELCRMLCKCSRIQDRVRAQSP